MQPLHPRFPGMTIAPIRRQNISHKTQEKVEEFSVWTILKESSNRSFPFSVSIPATTLPEMTTSSSSAIIRLILDATGALAMHSRREASKEHDERSKEEENRGGEDEPHANRVVCVGARTVLVHVVLNNAKESEVARHDDHADDECDGRDEGGEDGTTDTSAESKEESDEGQSASDGVKDHDSSKRLRGIDCCMAIADLVDRLHDGHWVVANVLLGAIVMVGLSGSDIANAVAEGTKCDGGMTNISAGCKFDLQHCNVADDRRRDGGNQEEDGCCKQQKSANMMEETGLCHFDEGDMAM